MAIVCPVDLDTRKVIWQKPFGTMRDSGPLLLSTGLPVAMGVPNIGGGVVTASGLAFIGATQEHMLRAYDLRTGRELWKGRLPAGGKSKDRYANPMTVKLTGKVEVYYVEG